MAIRPAASGVAGAMPTAAVSPDGRRVAIVAQAKNSDQLVTFDASRPAQRTVVLEFSGSVADDRGTPSHIVWAGDGSDSLLMTVQVFSPPSAGYTSQRVVDLQTRQVRELARVSFVPLAWHPASDTAVGVVIPDGGFADSYVLLQGGRETRLRFPRENPRSLAASPDGRRILAVYGGPSQSGGTIQWWPFDRLAQQTELPSVRGDWIVNATWRPGSDELVVGVETVSAAGAGPTAPRLEVWPLQGGHRLVRSSGGLLLVRTDGTAALTVDFMLVDLATGTTTAVPRLSPSERPYLAVRL